MSLNNGSRCCVIRQTPLEWEDFTCAAHHQIKAYEDWFRTLTPFARLHEEGIIEDLFETAARGELEDSGDHKTPIKPISSEPEVYELRLTVLSKRLRFYHGEPTVNENILVKLHRQIKTNNESQNEAIKFAGERYDQWYEEQ